MTDDTASAAIEQYLVDLYGSTPHGLLWIGGHADGWKGRTFAEPAAAARYAVELDARGGIGVYHRSTTLKRVPERRGEAEDSSHVYYFALDADIKGEGHKAENLPADRTDIERLIENAGVPAPTTWVFSGGGWYPQWRFPEPIDVTGQEALDWVTEVFAMVSAHFIETARGLGWRLDNVRDLARVFRLPGTTNRKVPGAEVTAREEAGTGECVDLGVLAGRARPRESAPPPVSSDLFEDAERGDGRRRFTEEQALTFIGEAYERMKGAFGPGSFNTPITTFAKVCSHFPWLVDRERCAANVDKALKRHNRSVTDKDYRLAIDSAYASTEGGKDWVAEKVEAIADERILPPPSWPLAVARILAGRIEQTAGELHRTWWRGDFYRWLGTHWEVEPIEVVRRWLYQQTGDAVYLVPAKKDGAPPVETAWAPTKGKVANLLEALGEATLQREGEPEEAMALANGVLEGRELRAHRPGRFNLSSLPFKYDPDAQCPEWLAFLESVLPADPVAQAFLAEWFGYVLSGRTDLQKIGVLVGPPRCGKGTAARVLKSLLGEDSWCAPVLARLGESFGLEGMVGKRLAVMGDVKWTSRHVVQAVPILLGVSGEDGFTVERKYRSDWVGKIGARFMLMSNDGPAFTDASGALAGRMVYVAFRQSFLGREDHDLGNRLILELPGILNWALDGLDRLNKQNGVFSQSANSLELRGEVDRDSSPVAAWVDDRCELEPGYEMTLEALFQGYRDWLAGEHIDLKPSAPRFSRDLQSAFREHGVTVVRKATGHGGKHRVVTGIRMVVGGSIPDGSLFEDPI